LGAVQYDARDDGKNVMTSSVTRVDGVVVMTVAGEIDLLAGPPLRAEVGDILAEADQCPVIVDLTAVTFLCSTGLAVLVDAHWQAYQRRRPVVLVVSDRQKAVPLALHSAGIARLFTTYSDPHEALRSCVG
jgi:anti-sigma B factor antagonist